ncbi:hypothetical protein G647_09217 [Cladophialophora carrionii CBS 160.54]|uniref:Uncharacterized protein n=1 Tax=Cladophialophora carrionii CBS 160.54 TaxID=1279043 RepID=V9CXQ3_9EURO|nr:uncharacterized protein G647_09217 [Cladophialophora carrionii CBS 160.54]ETI19384.1 hypothetical protein G647_09217 [Cladophialophora carrionii CBS 160.54]
MSLPSSELSWLSSDEIEALQAEIELDEESNDLQPVWSNTWTPINQTNSANVAPSSPSSPQQDADEEEQSASASCRRRAILDSADRMYETKTARKRKSLTASPPYTRKKGAVGVSLEDADHPDGLAQHKKPPNKRPRATRQPKAAQLQTTDSLIPIRSSKLNATSAAEKRTYSQALGPETETRPAKKVLTMRVASTPARHSHTDSVAKGKTETSRDLNGRANTKRHSLDIENTMQAEHEDSEDLFDNDDTCVEEFLEAEKALFAESFVPPTSSSNTAAMPDIDKKHKAPAKPSPSNNTGQSPMKPFIRPFAPLPVSQDASPTSPMVSPSHRRPICFRIAEALRHISSTFVSTPITPTTPVKTLTLEVYAILHSSSSSSTDDETSGPIEVVLADIFFPHRPPYLSATTTRKATMVASTSRKHQSPSPHLLKKLQGNLVCVVVQVTPPSSNTPPAVLPGRLGITPATPPLAGKYTTNTVLKIEHTDWDEIRRAKDILDGN